MAERGLTPWTGSRGLAPFGRDPFFSFRREMDRLFDDFFTPTAAEPRSFAGALGRGAFPSIDVEETKDGYKVTAELPGLDEKDVGISLRDNVLTINGEKREEKSEKDGARTWAERVYGRFERVLPLNAEIDADKVEAKFKNGVLTIMLPRSAKAQDQTRQIQIKQG